MVNTPKPTVIELVRAIHEHGYSVILIPIENKSEIQKETVADSPTTIPPMQVQLLRFLGESKNGEGNFNEWAAHLNVTRDYLAARIRGSGKSHGSVKDVLYTSHWVFKDGKRLRVYRLTEAGHNWLKENPA